MERLAPSHGPLAALFNARSNQTNQRQNESTRFNTEDDEPVPFNSICVTLSEKESDAFKAVRINDLMMITRLLNHGLDINSTNQDASDSTSQAYTINDRSRMVRPLQLKQYSLIHIATIHSNIETIEFLIEKGANINAGDLNNITSLALAAAVQSPQVIKLLLAHGADADIQSKSGSTPLIRALLANNHIAVKMLVDASKNLEHCDTKGTTALLACLQAPRDWGQQTVMMETLIKGGCNVNFQNSSGATPLMVASGMGRRDLAQLLIDAGADINHRDKKGKSCVHVATGVTTLLFLINRGADVTLADNKGETPLSRACHTGHIGLIRLLLGSDVPRDASMLDTPRVAQARQQVPVFDQWLNQEIGQPMSLKRLSRMSIRSALSPNPTPQNVHSLPLPRILNEFLLVKHIDLGWVTTFGQGALHDHALRT